MQRRVTYFPLFGPILVEKFSVRLWVFDLEVTDEEGEVFGAADRDHPAPDRGQNAVSEALPLWDKA